MGWEWDGTLSNGMEPIINILIHILISIELFAAVKI